MFSLTDDESHRDLPLPTVLTGVRRVFRYPPLLLLSLTLVALLLAMGTAQAQASAVDCAAVADAEPGPKHDLVQATCQLSAASYSVFLSYVSDEHPLIVEELSAEPWNATDDLYRRVFQGNLSVTLFESEIAPLLDLLALSRAKLARHGYASTLSCDDGGWCTQSTEEAEIRLQFSRGEGGLRLTRLRVAYYELGC